MSWTDLQAGTSSLAGIFASEGLAVPVIYNGATVSGIRTTVRRSDRNTDMGLLAGRYNFSVICRVQDFSQTGLPAPRTGKVWIGGTPYRVLAVSEDSISATCQLDLGDLLQ